MNATFESVRLLVGAPVQYAIRLADTLQEVRAAQALRYEVFNLELKEGLEQSHASRLDEDPFDAVCDHLVVEHLPTGNHVSYLDILILTALTPSRFVAKSEVKRWPVFGWFAHLAGTIFVERNRRSQARRAAEEIELALREGPLVVLFPEGTSSGGETVLPFKSSLVEPAARNVHSLTAGLIRYGLTDDDVTEEVCYWKDMTLVPHLINLLSKRTLRAFMHFTQVSQDTSDRKVLARQLHSEVLRLKTLTVNYQ
jgi:1-acyl-sn-glycerol-3-phosphate acyltransferase